MADLYRFSVEQCERLHEVGILREHDYIELLEGYLVAQRRPRSPLHCGKLQILMKDLLSVVPEEWIVRVDSFVTLCDSLPEMDLAIVRRNRKEYMHRHPRASEIAAVIELSDWTLELDRDIKCRIYARAGIPSYWIVNLVDRQIEVYTSPVGDPTPEYRVRTDRRPGDDLDVILDGQRVGGVSVSAVFA